MDYIIRNIDFVGLKKSTYFFDANLWIKILKSPLTPTTRDLKYLSFFESFKSNTNHPKIVLTSLVLSEVINRILRDVTYPKYLKKIKVTNASKSFYKEGYRPSEEFLFDYISILEDIKAYQNFFVLVDDGLGNEIKQKDILTSPSLGLDFNDNYYYQLALKRNYIIVTDDKDFFVPNIEVLTYNNILLDKAKSTLPIKGK